MDRFKAISLGDLCGYIVTMLAAVVIMLRDWNRLRPRAVVKVGLYDCFEMRPDPTKTAAIVLSVENHGTTPLFIQKMPSYHLKSQRRGKAGGYSATKDAFGLCHPGSVRLEPGERYQFSFSTEKILAVIDQLGTFSFHDQRSRRFCVGRRAMARFKKECATAPIPASP